MFNRPLRQCLIVASTIGSLIYVGSGCTNSTSPTAGMVPPPDARIVQGAVTKGNQAFSPNPFTTTLSSGGTVTWANGDNNGGVYGGGGVTHHLVSDSPLFDLGPQAAGASAQFTFTSTGTFTYHCAIHPTMVGAVQVNQ